MHPFQEQFLSSNLKLALVKCKMQSNPVTSYFIYILSISSFQFSYSAGLVSYFIRTRVLSQPIYLNIFYYCYFLSFSLLLRLVFSDLLFSTSINNQL